VTIHLSELTPGGATKPGPKDANEGFRGIKVELALASLDHLIIKEN
jgi:hypothetical protein